MEHILNTISFLKCRHLSLEKLLLYFIVDFLFFVCLSVCLFFCLFVHLSVSIASMVLVLDGNSEHDALSYGQVCPCLLYKNGLYLYGGLFIDLWVHIIGAFPALSGVRLDL